MSNEGRGVPNILDRALGPPTVRGGGGSRSSSPMMSPSNAVNLDAYSSPLYGGSPVMGSPQMGSPLNLDMYASPGTSPVLGSPDAYASPGMASPLDTSNIAINLKLNEPRLPTQAAPSAETSIPEKVVKIKDARPSIGLPHPCPTFVWKAHYKFYLTLALLALLALGLGLGLGLPKPGAPSSAAALPSPAPSGRPLFKNITTTTNVTVITYQNVTTLTTVKSTSLDIKLPVTEVNTAVGSALRCDLSTALATIGVDLSSVTLTGTASTDNSTTAYAYHQEANDVSSCSSRLLRQLLQGRGLEDSSSSSNATNSTSFTPTNSTNSNSTSSSCANTTSAAAVSSVGITIINTDNAAAIAALLSSYNFSAVTSAIAADPCLIPAGYNLSSLVPVTQSVVNTTKVVATVTEVATTTVVTKVEEETVVNSEATTPSSAPTPTATRSSNPTATGARSRSADATGSEVNTPSPHAEAATPSPQDASTPSQGAAAPGTHSSDTTPTTSLSPSPSSELTTTRVNTYYATLSPSASVTHSASGSPSTSLDPSSSALASPSSSSSSSALPSGGLSESATFSALSSSLTSLSPSSTSYPTHPSITANSSSSPDSTNTPTQSSLLSHSATLSLLASHSAAHSSSPSTSVTPSGSGSPSGSSTPSSSESPSVTVTVSPSHTVSSCPSTSFTPSGSGSTSGSPSTSVSPSSSPMPTGPYCEPGYYLNYTGYHYGPNLGDGVCTRCPRGFACPGGGIGGAIILPCLAATGFICPVGNPVQGGVPCPQGFYCPFNFSEAVTALPCPTGYYSEAGSGQCSYLPMGAQALAPQTSLLTPCNLPPGYYCPPSHLGSTSTGLLCPAGYFCKGGGLPPYPCPPGNYSLAGASSCTICPYNVFGSSYGLDEIPCSGTYLGVGSGPAATYALPPGSFYATSFDALGVATTPIPPACPPSTYAPEFYLAYGLCIPCPPGFACPGGSGVVPPIPCLPPLWSPGGVAACSTLASGQALVMQPSPPTESPTSPIFYTLYPSGTRTCPTATYPLLTPLYTPTANSTPPYPLFSQCAACPGGKFGLPPGSSSYLGPSPTSSDCSGQCSAPPGNYCPPGIHLPTGIACPFNATCPGGAALANCTFPKGSVFNLSNGNVCTPCWEGTHKGANGTACSPCPFGTFGDATGLTECQPCVAPALHPGYICPEGGRNASGVPCPAGTYRSLDDHVAGGCLACNLTEPGYYCPPASTAMGGLICPAGYTCRGAQAPPVPCPLGSYALEGSTTCTLCPLGYYGAALGTSETCNGLCIIAAGFYCPPGSTSITGSVCPYGYACDPLAFDPLPPLNEKPIPVTPVACPRGSYATKGSQYCSLCPVGYYGVSRAMGGMTCTGPCLPSFVIPGYYCPAGTNATNGSPCPAGYICPTGGGNVPSPCPPGSYSYAVATSCTNTTKGFYTDVAASTYPIPCGASTLPGYYCPAVSTSAAGVPCSAGYSCAGAQAQPVICPIGKYSYRAQSSCSLCREGAFGNATGLTSPDCTANCTKPVEGSYCPAGSVADYAGVMALGGYYATGKGAAHYPCSAGSYSLMNASFCPPCTATPGMYCGPACDTAAGCSSCPQGLYCVGGATVPTLLTSPAPGKYFPASSTSAASFVDCPAGSYCPTGSTDTAAQKNCEPWYVCTADPAGKYFSPLSCPEKTGSNAGSSAEGQCGVCAAPPGSYCPVGSSLSGVLCPAGSFCEGGEALANPCTSAEGSYCPEGSSTIGGVSCPAGYFCTGGSANKRQCYAGSYSLAGKMECTDRGCPGTNYHPAGSTSSTGLTCPEGDYCEGCYPYACPKGHYCTGGNFNKCPAGKYAPEDGTRTVCTLDCASTVKGYWCGPGAYLSYGVVCKEGYYGGEPGGAYPYAVGAGYTNDQCTGACSEPPGYYCPPGTTVPSNKTGVCQPGKYCPGGGGPSSMPIPCPAGKYSDVEAASTCTDCTCSAGNACPVGSSNTAGETCPRGYYCPTGGSSLPIQCACAAGRYCPSGSSSVSCSPVDQGWYSYSGNQYLCLGGAGYYCAEGSQSDPTPTTPCPAGSFCKGYYYSPEICPAGKYSGPAAAQCTACACPAGQFCDATGAGATSQSCSACTSGYTCAGGSAGAVACSAGKYASSSTVCTSCPAGKYTGTAGNAQCTSCSALAGFYCKEGSTSAAGESCPSGSACAGGTANSVVCAPGKVNTLVSACYTCTVAAGSYCDGMGTALTCTEGNFCTGAYAAPAACSSKAGAYCPPGSKKSVDTVCPAGSKCAGGGSPHVECPEGSYAKGTGNTDCNPCTLPPAGSYCPQASTDDGVGVLCTLGMYCPGGESPRIPCPAGNISAITGASFCTVCPNATYSLAASSSCSECAAPPGSWCSEQTPVPQGFLCPPGYYCNRGNVSMPVPGNASLGYYIAAGSINASATPTVECLPGHACYGVPPALPTPCPEGSYSINITRCADCTANVTPGRYCAEMSTPSDNTAGGLNCTAGSYCLGYGNPRRPCPAGYACPANTYDPIICPLGRYSYAAQAACTDCPSGVYGSTPGRPSPACTAPCSPVTPGMYCPSASTSNTLITCPAGFACPSSRSLAVANECPPGYFAAASALTCLPCPAGRYGGAYRLPSANCSGVCQLPAGYYCSLAALGPLDGTICPAGFTCLGGGTVPTFCARGNYQDPNTGACTTCPAGVYGGESGMVAPLCSGNCTAPPGNYCPAGSKSTLGIPCPTGKTCSGLAEPPA